MQRYLETFGYGGAIRSRHEKLENTTLAGAQRRKSLLIARGVPALYREGVQHGRLQRAGHVRAVSEHGVQAVREGHIGCFEIHYRRRARQHDCGSGSDIRACDREHQDRAGRLIAEGARDLDSVDA